VAAPDEAGDVARLLGAFRDWWGYTAPGDESMRASVERLLGDDRTEFLLGAAGAQPSPAGVVQLRYRHSVWTGSDDAWLEDLYVLDAARRTGLGRALTEFALERARSRGCMRIQLDVNAANDAAKRLYESLGFSSWSESLGADTLFMTRVLQDVRHNTQS
jgi:ribosomal protein S18 acetylase RimI-like enzyme